MTKPVPRVTPSPKSEIKRKRSEDLDGAPKDQNHQKLARYINGKTIEASCGWCERERRRAEAGGSFVIIKTGRASAGNAVAGWKLALTFRDKYNRVRLGYSNLLTSIEADPSTRKDKPPTRNKNTTMKVPCKLHGNQFQDCFTILDQIISLCATCVNRFLEPFTECASVSDDKDRQILHLIKTEEPKATVYVCTSCTVVSLSTTAVNFNTPPLPWIATLMQDS